MQVHRILGSLFLVLFFIAPAHASGEDTGPRMKSCSLAADPARCEARIAARKACRNARPGEKKQCMAKRMPPVDCSKAANPKRCLAKQQRPACKAKKGKSCRRRPTAAAK